MPSLYRCVSGGPASQPTVRTVSHGTPAVLHAWDENLPKTRLGFAQWLMSPENPLTARVTVNRWWGNLFGLGLVRTEDAREGMSSFAQKRDPEFTGR